MAWKRYSISIHPKVWDEVQMLLREEFNMSMSKYIEMTLRQLLDSRTKTAKELYEGVAQTLFDEMAKPKKKVTKSTQMVHKKDTKKK